MPSMKVAELLNTRYGQDNVDCEPSKEEIESAIQENTFEPWDFQTTS